MPHANACACVGDDAYGGLCAQWDSADEEAWCRVKTADACGNSTTFATQAYSWSHEPCKAPGAVLVPYDRKRFDALAALAAAAVVARSAVPRLTLHVFVTNYYNARWTALNIQKLTQLARYRHAYTVLSMEDTHADFMRAKRALPSDVRVEHFHPPRGVIGGAVLTSVMQRVGRTSVGNVTLVADSDAVVLARDWDVRVLGVYSDPGCVLAAINPRPGFTGIAEWNWMTFRTSFYQPRLAHVHAACIDKQGCEHGHWFTLEAAKARRSQFLWGDARAVFADKSPVVVLDRGAPWVLHCFYTSRKRNEAASLSAGGALSDEGKIIMSTAQEQELMKRVKTNSVRMQPGACYAGVFSVGRIDGRCVRWYPRSHTWSTTGCADDGARCACAPARCV